MSYPCLTCDFTAFDHEYQLQNHNAQKHTRLFTCNGVLISDGMPVWNNNLDLVLVDLSNARAEHNGDVWFDTKYPNGSMGPLLNGDRTGTVHPSTRQLASDAYKIALLNLPGRTCNAEIFGGSRYEQATFCENDAELGSEYCAGHCEPVEDEFMEEPTSAQPTVMWNKLRVASGIDEYDEERSEVAISIAGLILDECGVDHSVFDDSSLADLRAVLQTLVEIIEANIGIPTSRPLKERSQLNPGDCVKCYSFDDDRDSAGICAACNSEASN